MVFKYLLIKSGCYLGCVDSGSRLDAHKAAGEIIRNNRAGKAAYILPPGLDAMRASGWELVNTCETAWGNLETFIPIKVEQPAQLALPLEV